MRKADAAHRGRAHAREKECTRERKAVRGGADRRTSAHPTGAGKFKNTLVAAGTRTVEIYNTFDRNNNTIHKAQSLEREQRERAIHGDS